jgi:hypothetical protein
MQHRSQLARRFFLDLTGVSWGPWKIFGAMGKKFFALEIFFVTASFYLTWWQRGFRNGTWLLRDQQLSRKWQHDLRMGGLPIGPWQQEKL